MDLKEKGNAAFKQGDYPAAESLFSQAIQKKPHEPTFFTNRALTRLRLANWTGVEHDARAAITLHGPKNPSSLKASSYLVQALLGLQQPQEAYDVAIDAYRASLSAKSVQSETLSRLVLRCKQGIWAGKETGRLRGMNETLDKVEGLMGMDLERGLNDLKGRWERGELGDVGLREDERVLREEAEMRIGHVREAFRLSSGGKIHERVVPDYLVDGITFEIMHDPVMTPSGSSFDRLAIVKYVEQAGVDPITRTGMTVNDLRPNYALKAACEDFLDRNGWAVDW